LQSNIPHSEFHTLLCSRVFRQLTHAPHGHVLANAAVWSPDGAWLAYDVRSDPAGSAFDGTRIERVQVETGEVQVLYESRRGACCGVPLVNPVDGHVAFILGPENPTPDWQYNAWHRRGVIVDPDRPGAISNLDARDLAPPFTAGALRGGSHVHQFSPDGRRVSFTYEDHVLATIRPPSPHDPGGATTDGGSSNDNPPPDLNQRNVAVAFPRRVVVPRTHPRNHDGEFFAVVVSETVNNPRPGSDDVARAYEEAWLGGGSSALAFLGDVVTRAGAPLTELFLLELPADLTQPGARPLEGTPTRRPAPPAGARQRRLTHTAERKFPGVHGPRHWPRSAPDGSHIAFLMRDDAGVVQLWTIAARGGDPRQLTHDPFPIASAFTWSPDGARLAYIADGSVMLADAGSGHTRRVTPPAPHLRPEACVFAPDGARIAFVREVDSGDRRCNQVCVANVE
jgi:Tol biopolymer transport system component